MPSTTQQLKDDINTGKTGDKVPEAFDPGLSTLGTDDEAAGTPNTLQQVAAAISLETRGAPRPPPEQSAVASQRRMPALWVMVGAFVLVLIVLALAIGFGRG